MSQSRYRSIPFLLALAVLAATSANAWDLLPRYRFQTVVTADKAGVNTVLEDQQGFIWVGMQSGLHRLESSRLSRAADRPKVPINDLLEDRHHGLWVAHAKGLARWQRATDRWQETPCQLADNGVFQLADSPAALHALTRQGVMKVDAATGACSPLKIAGLPEKTAIERIGVFDGALLLALRERGLYRCVLPCQTATPWATEMSAMRVRLISAAGPHVYAGTHKHGLFRLSREGRVLHNWKRGDPGATAEKALPTNGAMSVAEAADGSVWTGLWAGGLVEIDREGKLRVNARLVPYDPYTVGGENVKALVFSRDGTLHAGHENGLSVLLPAQNQWPWISTRSERHAGFARPEVQSLTSESDDVVWVGTPRGGLYRVDLAANQLRAFEHDPKDAKSFPSHAIWDTRIDAAGNLVVGTSSGVVQMSLSTYQWKWLTRGQPLPSTDVFRVALGPDGDIWIAMWSGGVARLSPQGGLKKAWRSADGLRVDTASAIEVAPNGDVFVLNPEGLFHLPDGDITQAFRQVSAADTRLQQMALARDGTLAGIDQGGRFWQWRPGTNQDKPALVATGNTVALDGPITRMVAVKPGAGEPAFWLLGANALAGVDATGKTLKTKPLTGVPAAQVTSLGIANADATRVVVAGNEGVHVLALAQTLKPPAPRAPMISSVLMFNQPYRAEAVRVSQDGPPVSTLFNNALTLRYDQDLLSLEFSVPGMLAGDAPRYRYRLAPFDRDWISAAEEDARATYTRLPPGKYVFTVEAIYPGAVSSMPVAAPAFAIEVLPPWWLTWWARLVAVLVIFAAILAFIRWRTVALRTRNVWLEERVVARTAELAVVNHKLEAAAAHDALTGLYNRRGLRENTDKRWASIAGQAVLLIGDIDHFKLFNDRHGHHVGDEVLVEMGKRLRATTRESDALARWGGEEFIVLLTGTDAMERARQLQQSVGATPMPLSIGPTTVTMTAGVMPVTEASFEDTLKAADERLYAGKAAGRNRLVAA